MSITKSKVKNFLLEKKGYLKKSPLKVAQAIWKNSPQHTHRKTKSELEKELEIIKDVQAALRVAASSLEEEEEGYINDIYNKIIDEKSRPKRKLFFDLETSPNVVFAWRTGRKIDIGHNAIIKERAIICVSYKWSDEDEVHSISWNKGCDKELVKKFAKIIETADEIVGQNSDAFDVKWLRTRCIFHNVPLTPKFNSIDTLKFAKAGFYFNSNKLDYMGDYLGVGRKVETTYDLWRDICLNNSSKAMKKMVEYCEEDVRLLERVYNKLQPYSPVKKFKYKS